MYSAVANHVVFTVSNGENFDDLLKGILEKHVL